MEPSLDPLLVVLSLHSLSHSLSPVHSLSTQKHSVSSSLVLEATRPGDLPVPCEWRSSYVSWYDMARQWPVQFGELLRAVESRRRDDAHWMMYTEKMKHAARRQARDVFTSFRRYGEQFRWMQKFNERELFKLVKFVFITGRASEVCRCWPHHCGQRDGEVGNLSVKNFRWNFLVDAFTHWKPFRWKVLNEFSSKGQLPGSRLN